MQKISSYYSKFGIMRYPMFSIKLVQVPSQDLFYKLPMSLSDHIQLFSLTREVDEMRT